MLKKIGIALLGLMAAAVLALAWYGLCVGLGFVGTQFLDNNLFTSDSLFWRGMLMIGYAVLMSLYLAIIALVLRLLYLAAHGLGEGALFLWRRLCSKPKKARA